MPIYNGFVPSPDSVEEVNVQTNAEYGHTSGTGNLEFRAEAYNLTNTPAFGYPNTSVTSSAFGLVTLTQTNDPRLLQLALKLNF